MQDMPTAAKDRVVVIAKTGRLQSWDMLSMEDQEKYTRDHLDLILDVGSKYGIERLEAFRLIGIHQPWERMWLAEFPTFEGAEEWIQAEMAPPYGSDGYWEYYLARPWGPDYFSTWVINKRKTMAPLKCQNPNDIAGLKVDEESVVILMFGRGLPGSDLMSIDDRGDKEHVDLMKAIASEYGLMRLEGFKLIAPLDQWHRAWVIEFPTMAGAEAWMEAEVLPVYGTYNKKTYYLARNYFCADIARFKPNLQFGPH
ncbi:MAG: hypothetical protein QGF12_09175 [SAR202 cluster bacterium]|jgi:hypothetical protein|nr:hypothetical protein [SAR202 cluster bacterium]